MPWKPYMVAMPCRRQCRWSPRRQASHSRHDWNTCTATRSPRCTPQRSAAAGAELLDDPDGLVPGDEGPAGVQLAGVLLVVGAAEAARLDPEEPVVGADLGERRRRAPRGVAGVSSTRARAWVVVAHGSRIR